jgi:L-amino acid N-acyltransferase YncA
MVIRDADPRHDAGACAAIYAPFVRDTAVSFEESAPDTGAMAQRIASTQRTHPWVVAQVGDVIAGYAYASSHRVRSAYRWTADVGIYVGDGHRRHGVGRALYEALLGLLSAQGFHIACAGITLPNAASVALHEAVGFTPVGVYRQIGFKHGVWHDVGWWQRRLTDSPPVPPPSPGPPLRLGDSGDPGATAGSDQ